MWLGNCWEACLNQLFVCSQWLSQPSHGTLDTQIPQGGFGSVAHGHNWIHYKPLEATILSCQTSLLPFSLSSPTYPFALTATLLVFVSESSFGRSGEGKIYLLPHIYFVAPYFIKDSGRVREATLAIPGGSGYWAHAVLRVDFRVLYMLGLCSTT